MAKVVEPFVDQFDGNATTRKYLCADALLSSGLISCKPSGCIAACGKCGVPYEYENGDLGAKDECTYIVNGRDIVDGAPAVCPIARAVLGAKGEGT